MAVLSKCAELRTGQDSTCTNLQRRFFQQAVVINKSDIESYTIKKSDPIAPTYKSEYNVKFNLKSGKTGYRFAGAEKGSSFFGNFDKSTSDLGFSQYIHRVQMLVVGIQEESKSVLDSLDKGEFVTAMQFKDGTVEIYGMESGLTTADYTYDVQANGGGTVIQLQSTETAPENTLPLIYKAEVEGGEAADFDSLFASV